MAMQAGFFDVDERLKRLSDLGDQLEAYAAAVDFEIFRAELDKALAYSDGKKVGYKNHAGIDKAFRLIRTWAVTDAASHDGRMLRRGLLDTKNTASGVWADSAYRSKTNEAFMDRHGFTSHVHHRKPKGKPMPKHIRRGNATKSRHRAPVEHVFAVQKHMMGLTIRTIGIARAKTKIGMANLAYNIRRLVQLKGALAA